MEGIAKINFNNNSTYSSIKEVEDKFQENTNLLKNEEIKTAKNKMESCSIDSQSSQSPLVYGNNKILMYLNNEPFIVIGPHCKINIYLNFKNIKNKKGPFFYAYWV